MQFAPIYIAACRRPKHLKQLLDTLKMNAEAIYSDLNIVIGGPQDPKHFELVQKTKEVALDATGFQNLRIHEQYDLLRGSDLIHYCLERAFKAHDRVIILEDDLIVRQDFLLYMNSALNYYSDDDGVGQISAWNFGVMDKSHPERTYFFPNSTSWGWATWKRAWVNQTDLESNYKWVTSKYSRVKEFNHGGTYDDIGMIEAIRKDNYDAWDAAWALDCYRKNRMTLYPNSSLVINNGFDGTGLNFKNRFGWTEAFAESPQKKFEFSKPVRKSLEYRKFIRAHKLWVRKSNNWLFFIIYVDIVLRNFKQHFRYFSQNYYLK
jgi:hypothetical protein